MKINFAMLYRILFIIGLLIYVKFSEITSFTLKMDAILTLVFSVIFLFKNKRNLPISLVAFFIFYCTYSIVVGEYLVGGELGIPVYEVKTLENYGLLIRLLLLFMGIVSVFSPNKELNLSEFELKPKNNIVLFCGLFLILIYVLLFGINRGDLTSYSVKVTPLYEYSTLLFLLAYYFSGKVPLGKTLLSGLLLLFVLQDFYYGGRITSLQLIFLFLVTIFLRKLSYKFILIYGFVGILLNSLVGAYRRSYSLDSVSIVNIFLNLKDNLFVFDTPVYAYYASATHTATSNLVSSDLKIDSLITFIQAVFIGSDNELSNLTRYVHDHYFINIGGGVLPSYFYFWLGWIGIVIIASVIVFLLNKMTKANNDFKKLCFLTIIITVPRWFLYSPLNLFRPLIFLTVMYLLLIGVHKILVKVSNRNRIVPKT